MNSFFAPDSAMEKNKGRLWTWTPSKGEKNLRHLNACYLDIDCGRNESGPEGMNPLEVEFRIRRAAAEGLIPTPSGFIYSGQGIWVLWLLKFSHERCRAGDKRLRFYKDINKALAAPFPDLAVDKEAVDGSRLVRFPESIHSGTGKKVRWSFQGNENGVFRYHLDELGAFLQIEKPKDKKRTSRPSYRKNHKPNAGYRAVNEMRVRDWEKIFKAGLVRKGERSFSLHSMARHLIALGQPLEPLRQLRNHCKPPLESNAVESIIQSYRDLKPHHIFAGKDSAGAIPTNTNKTILSRLDLSQEQVSDLGLETIRHPIPTVRKKTKVKARQEKVSEILEVNPNTPRRELAESFGVSLRTIERDVASVFKHWPTTHPHHATKMAVL